MRTGALTRRHLFWQITLSAVAGVVAGCGSSHHGGGTTTPSNTPVITDLGVATSPQGCAVQGFSGHPRTISLNFTDTDGNENGGHLDLTLSGGGPTQSVTLGVPSRSVTISGTTSGTITAFVCIAVVGGSATLSVTLIDAGGNTSNTLSAAVAGLRPTAGPPGTNQVPSAGVGMGLSAL